MLGKKQRSIGMVSRFHARLMVAPAVIFLFLVGLFPLLYSLYLTVHNYKLTSRNYQFVGAGNLEKLLADERLLESLKKTFSFTVQAIGIEALLGVTIALLLAMYGGQIIRSVIILPMIIAPTVVGLIWRFMYNNEIGVINFLLESVGITPPLWLGNPSVAMQAAVLVDVWQWTPFVILIVLAGLLSLPPDLDEAAAVDGAGALQIVRYIKLPLVRPAIFVAVAFRAIDALRTFDSVWVLTAGGPNNVTEFLSIYTYKVSLRFFELSYGAALSFVLLILIVIVGRVLFRVIRFSN